MVEKIELWLYENLGKLVKMKKDESTKVDPKEFDCEKDAFECAQMLNYYFIKFSLPLVSFGTVGRVEIMHTGEHLKNLYIITSEECIEFAKL